MQITVYLVNPHMPGLGSRANECLTICTAAAYEYPPTLVSGMETNG